MSNVKMNFKLKQNTPMVHFQYYEDGVVIRGSELKPKLDNFLMKKYAGDLDNDWFIKTNSDNENKKKALNYKIRVYSYKAPHYYDKPHRNSMYFGNMGEDAQIKKYVFYNEGVDLEIVCMFPKLRELIAKCLAEFFAVTNFGTRQDKGFGCFQLVTKETVDYKKMLKDGGYTFFYCDVEDYKDVGKYKKVEQRLDIIYSIYSVMKGGINRTGYDKKRECYLNKEAYIKGYIQRAFLDNNSMKEIGSDKAFIKENILKNTDNGTKERGGSSINYNDYYFVRALLGLADSYKFRDDIRDGEVRIYNFYGTTKNENGEFVFNEKSVEKNEGICRFRSPVTATVVDDKIFFIFEKDLYSCICGEIFFFLSKEDSEFFEGLNNTEEKINFLNRHKENAICVPKEFDCVKFIDGFIEYYNSKETKYALNKLTDLRLPGRDNNNYPDARKIGAKIVLMKC